MCVREREREREDLACFANYSKYIVHVSTDSVLDVSLCEKVQSKE